MNKHDEMTDRIRRCPNILGIEHTVASTGEAIIFQGHRYVTSPDNLIFTSSELYVVEYKSSDRKREKDMAQLKRHLQHVRRLHLGYETIGLYVHGSEKKLKIEEL